MIDLTGRVAIVTGAGSGLGREHALLLARRGAKIVVNDMHAEPAGNVADEIVAAGGEAFAYAASVTDFDAIQAMVAETLLRWGQIDILVNNAGIIRDKSFAKMDLADFRLVLDVHVMGAANCTKAVWDHMRERQYGRIVMTTSSSGLYGNFGQANYGAAKMALVGLMQTLAIEGAKYNIRVNSLAPTAATPMVGDLFPAEQLSLLETHRVSPAILALVREDAPSRVILTAGGGGFESAHVTLTQGIYLEDGPDAAERLVERWDEVIDRSDETTPDTGFRQLERELAKAEAARKG
ncbi:SDR family NAD(P)-dependent oxidoreductase [Aquamicrobium zhengzhouense]|uniref:SDR family NAD(P)-dependent oxidoreductase n=1 Tax=Aquamicrobium zhengzhouense TaxID=2781738 RepID=A0ABS0SF07_9HYPH|nr:SDR family NAD(P)-dependent oxidoreductase [Aquamicrobium zhengzhouense]MBI1621883.1 SDR family NAD(P)-dependent oxidoreductase [Aquamicrobium zhengzhouense]